MINIVSYGQFQLIYNIEKMIILTEIQIIKSFDELNTKGSDFSNGFRCSDVHKFEKLNNLFINIFELNFYQDGNNWKHNLIPIDISKN